MPRMHKRTLITMALLPVALPMAVVGQSGAAFASAPAAVGTVTSSNAGATTSGSYYTIKLSSPRATVQAGGATTVTVRFRATSDLYGTPVRLSVNGLPNGVTASFSPSAITTIGSKPVLALTAAPSSPAGAFAVTVTAITLSTDPIGTSPTFGLKINRR